MSPEKREGISLDETEPWDETPSDLPLTELGMARRLVLSFNAEVRYAPQVRSWFFYNGQRWVEDITGDIQRRAKGVVDRLDAEARFSVDRREELTQAWFKFQSAARIRSIVELATVGRSGPCSPTSAGRPRPIRPQSPSPRPFVPNN